MEKPLIWYFQENSTFICSFTNASSIRVKVPVYYTVTGKFQILTHLTLLITVSFWT